MTNDDLVRSWLAKAGSDLRSSEIIYPDDFHAPSKEEAEEAFAIAREIRAFVQERISKNSEL